MDQPRRHCECGGGWAAKIGNGVLSHLAQDLSRRGVAVYNVEYRRVGTGGGWPTTFTDALYAYRTASTLHRRWPQLSATRMVVAGHSAGAQLAALPAMPSARHLLRLGDAADPYPRAFVSLAGAVNLRREAFAGRSTVIAALGGVPAAVPDRYDTVDPIGRISPFVRTILVHGTADRVVPYALADEFYPDANDRHTRPELIPVVGGSHTSLVNHRSRRAYLDSLTAILSATKSGSMGKTVR
ncbi:alpha/beta hydrolase family protein [Gordonia sp. MP11Mi]|uniref:BD-FAE-like domain-containing protein n=1 Tax=Gordonia sp. MP11Mi TaxID=3022769 RepID=A0AA97GVG2_9ACTN